MTFKVGAIENLVGGVFLSSVAIFLRRVVGWLSSFRPFQRALVVHHPSTAVFHGLLVTFRGHHLKAFCSCLVSS